MKKLDKFEIWAHRGLHSHSVKENSLRAVEDALKAMLKHIELDVWLHQSQLVLSHDEPGSGTYDSLEEVLTLINGKAETYLELKHVDAVKPTISLLKKTYPDYIDKVIFASFDIDTLRTVRGALPSARIGLNYRGVDDHFIDLAEELNAEYISMNWLRIIPNYFNLKQARAELDVKILAYTINTKFMLSTMKRLGASGVLSDKSLNLL